MAITVLARPILGRFAPLVVIGIGFGLVAYALPLHVMAFAAADGLGWSPESDFAFFRAVGERWIETGELYPTEQLNGQHFTNMVTVAYPPPILLLFVPFVWLPPVLWWIVPCGVLAYALWRWRPGRWAWAGIALCLAWPTTLDMILIGNTNLWASAGVAAGLLWGWPAVLLVLKPSLAPLALIGARRRSWFVAAMLLAVVSLPLLPLWLDYIGTLHSTGLPLRHVAYGVPLVLIPVAAWAGRTVSRPAPSP